MMKRLIFKRYASPALATLAVVGASIFAHAQQPTAGGESLVEGRVVQIGPGGAGELPIVEETEASTAQQQAPNLWVGISGRPVASDILRTHLQLANDLGVVIEHVVPDSPADKAGLRQHDVLIGVNSAPATDLAVLQQAVLAGDAHPIELKIIRLAKEMKLSVTPEPMPAEMASQFERARQRMPRGQNRQLGQLFRQLEGLQGLDQDLFGELPQALRNVGPGIAIDGQRHDFGGMPNGVAVSVSREDDGQVTVTVKRGGETWIVEGDDQEALEQLPEDLRPMVRRLLHSTTAAGGMQMFQQFDFDTELENLLPDNLGNLDFSDLEQRVEQAARRGAEAAQRARRAAQQLRGQAGHQLENADAANRRIFDRMQQMEQQIEQMQRQLKEAPAASRPSDDPAGQ